MSYITEAVIYAPYLSSSELEALCAPLPFDGARSQHFSPLNVDAAGGSKWFTGAILAAAFNHLPSTDELEAWFRRAAPRDASLVWNTEGEFSGSVVAKTAEPGWGTYGI